MTLSPLQRRLFAILSVLYGALVLGFLPWADRGISVSPTVVGVIIARLYAARSRSGIDLLSTIQTLTRARPFPNGRGIVGRIACANDGVASRTQPRHLA